ncbi:MAG: hypothetical protein WC565_03035 [Parcubacteria group bacterium]
MAAKKDSASVDLREQIARALDSVGYESVEDLVKKLITQTRPHKQSITCPHCKRKSWVQVDQPAPDKIAKGLEILANQAKGAPGKAPDRPRQPTMADQLTSLSNDELARIVGT